MNNHQKPLGLGFGTRTTTTEVLEGIDLSGTTALVTGGYSGLGLETTRALVRAGAEVLIPARRPDEARTVLSGLPRVTVYPMDLSRLESIASFTAGLVERGRPLDMVINSAAIMTCPETRVWKEMESQFAVNHLGHFYMIQGLWPLLARANGCRVVTVSSGAHQITDILWENIRLEGIYEKWLAYGQSKTANSLFTVALDSRGRDYGIRAFTLHPGFILTPLQRHLEKREMVDAGWIDESGKQVDPQFKTPEQGAATQVWAATSPQLEGLGGVYCADCDIAPVLADGKNSVSGVKPYAIDPEGAERLWQLSAELTGSKTVS